MSEPAFVPGLALNGAFYRAAVRPILARAGVGAHSAALIGYGSDVLGFDTPRSRDHNWGPRLQIFLGEDDFATLAEPLNSLLRRQLPPQFQGYSVHYTAEDPTDNNTQLMTEHTGGQVNHLIEITTVDRYTRRYLNVAPDAPLSTVDWLALPEQRLLEFTAGQVYHDGLGTLNAARARFAYYPRSVWQIRLAAQWQRIAEEEPFVGRTGDVGDEIGSWMLAARLTRDIMRLAFLYARRYAPYSKWLGTAFSRLPIATKALPIMRKVQQADCWHNRERALCALFTLLATEHNRLGLTPMLNSTPRPFFDRPYQVIDADRFATAVLGVLPEFEDQPQFARLGAVDQFSDNVAIHSSAARSARLKSVYRDDVEPKQEE